MLNQSLVSTTINEPPKPSVSSKKCNWICQIITWVLLIIVIISIIYKGFSTDIFIPFFFFAIGYITYLGINFSSKENILLSSIEENRPMFSYMEGLYTAAPVIRMKSVSYHFFNATKKNKVIAYKDEYEMPYYSYRDVSGVFMLDLKDMKNNSKAYIQLALKKEINFADGVSYDDYMKRKNEFWTKNRYIDLLMDYKEERIIPGYTDTIFLKIDGQKGSMCMTRMFFWLCTFFTFAEIYKIYFKSKCIFQTYTIRKLISTRFNLNDEEHMKKYKQFMPSLSLCNQMYAYGTGKSGNVNLNFKVEIPSSEEVKANEEKYKDFIPNYEISMVKGESGVVKDLPNYDENIFNCPPPQFASLKGEIELGQKLLRPIVEEKMKESEGSITIDSNNTCI